MFDVVSRIQIARCVIIH